MRMYPSIEMITELKQLVTHYIQMCSCALERYELYTTKAFRVRSSKQLMITEL